MTARVTQQVLIVAYVTSPTIRISSVALEVVRSIVVSPETNRGVQVIVVGS